MPSVLASINVRLYSNSTGFLFFLVDRKSVIILRCEVVRFFAFDALDFRVYICCRNSCKNIKPGERKGFFYFDFYDKGTASLGGTRPGGTI